MNYSTIRHTNGVAAAIFAAVSLMSLGSCTEVDDRLGADLIPKNQRMEIEVTSPKNGVKTYLFREDSIPSSRTGHAWFGRTVDADGIFGAQTGSSVLQFLPISRPYANADGYGIDPIVDSALILFTIDDVRGDTTLVQRFDVWEVKGTSERLHRDSTYYANFPIERFRGEKLFEFTHTGRRDVQTRLFPTAAGKAYLDRIVRLDWEDYITDSVFLDKFQGLYITPAEGSPAAAALYGADLTASGLQFYVRNHDTLDVSAIYDTISTTFSFRDTDVSSVSNGTVSTAYDNVSINMTTFDYTGSVLGAIETETNGFTDTLPTSSPRSSLYIQAGGGVGAYLRFSDELIEEIRNLKFKIDETGAKVGKDIAINQAMMRIWLEDASTATLDRSMTRLGSYLNPKKLTPIPDYQYATEFNENRRREEQNISGKYTLPYGGYLNRSNGYYELDITSYIQQLSKVKEDDPEYKYISPAIFIAPEAYGVNGLGQSVLKGFGSDQPVSIRITYTIIEG